MNDENEKKIKDQKKWAREYAKEWVENKNRMLEPTQIDALLTIGIKNLEGQPLTDNQRKQKSTIHKMFANAFFDIDRMIDMGFLGASSPWNPSRYGRAADRIPFSPESIWKKDFPVKRVCRFITVLVNMFGDEYAAEMARAIAAGLAQRPENSGRSLDVPIIKRAMGHRPGIVNQVI